MGIKSLLKAVSSVGPSPCEYYACSRRTQCSEEKLACESFYIYVERGTTHPPTQPATADIFERTNHDRPLRHVLVKAEKVSA